MQKHNTKDDAYKCDHFSQLVLFFSAENSLENIYLVNSTIDFDRCHPVIFFSSWNVPETKVISLKNKGGLCESPVDI